MKGNVAFGRKKERKKKNVARVKPRVSVATTTHLTMNASFFKKTLLFSSKKRCKEESPYAEVNKTKEQIPSNPIKAGTRLPYNLLWPQANLVARAKKIMLDFSPSLFTPRA